jgi:hypothetical protein
MGVERNQSLFWREKEAVRPLDTVVWGLAVAACLAGAFVYVYPSIQSTNLMYDYSDRIRELNRDREFNKKLRLEIAALRSYDLIERKATREFGFVQPVPGQVVIIAKKGETTDGRP